MADEVLRKNIQVNLQTWETLTDMKHGNMTYNDVIVLILEKAKIPLKVLDA